MEFTELIKQYDWNDLQQSIRSKTKADVEIALGKSGRLTIDDFMALLSPAAQAYIEPMAQLSRRYTQQRFGKTIRFYLPLYLTNSCTNHCVYCGFNIKNEMRRVILTDEQILREVAAIKKMGDFHHILLVTGENPRDAGADYIRHAIELIKPFFSSVDIEVQPLKEEEYASLSQAGLNAVYCYQETYNRERYKVYHPKGMKSKFDWRLGGYDRMGRAGVHKIGLGVLLGLEDWQTEAAMIAIHLRYLQKTYWRTQYSLSFPRMRPHAGEGFQPNVIVSDKDLAQLIFAFRIFDHDIEMALSTRETPVFRDHMTTLGITSLSAGSKTNPGGYSVFNELEQFAVNDDRHPQDVMQAVVGQGYEVVWKDWDLSLQ